MTTVWRAGFELTAADRGAISAALPYRTVATILGSATFGGFHPGRSDVDIVAWSDGMDTIAPIALECGSEVRVTLIDRFLAERDPGFARTLEAHQLVTTGRVDVMGDKTLMATLAKPSAPQLLNRRFLELQMVVGWISKAVAARPEPDSWFLRRKLVLRATKVEARLRGIDMYRNDEAQERAQAMSGVEFLDSQEFLSAHLEWLRGSLRGVAKELHDATC